LKIATGETLFGKLRRGKNVKRGKETRPDPLPIGRRKTMS